MIVVLVIAAGLILLVVPFVVRGLLYRFSERHYLRGLNDNEPVKNWQRQAEYANNRANIAWTSAYRWYREVVALNKAQRKNCGHIIDDGGKSVPSGFCMCAVPRDEAVEYLERQAERLVGAGQGPSLAAPVDVSSEDDSLYTFYAHMDSELTAADSAWPDGDIYLRLAALTGEVGELAEGVIKDRSIAELYDEAVQVAVTAFRVARVLIHRMPAYASLRGVGPADAPLEPK